ncbi:hypothetical protein GJ496_002735 [Pomphorhynchus laevis]|nr:hypothetical protein GJ496_002735 [Pomphorhynchus laevis]
MGITKVSKSKSLVILNSENLMKQYKRTLQNRDTCKINLDNWATNYGYNSLQSSFIPAPNNILRIKLTYPTCICIQQMPELIINNNQSTPRTFKRIGQSFEYNS